MKAFLAACLLVVASGVAAAQSSSFSTFYDFPGGADGSEPSSLVADAAGNLYGTTFDGGNVANCSGCGTVFELSPPAAVGGAWTETVLYNFMGFSDGNNPEAGLTFDSAGNLYGTTAYGGGNVANCAYGCGTVFMLSPPAAGQTSWTEAVLYRFTGAADGGMPFTSLAIDKSGSIYGTSYYFGDTASSACMPASQPAGCGLVYKLSPPAAGQTAWVPTVLHTFTNTPDGAYPASGVIIDDFGNLYGTTAYGGKKAGAAYGTVYRLAPPAAAGKPWQETLLLSFNYTDGYFPFDDLIFGTGGLFGTTRAGGLSCAGSKVGCGVVFKLARPGSGTAWTEQVLHKFKGGKDGAYPSARLTFDSAGDLLGTTTFGGGGPCQVASGYPSGCGTVYSLTPPSSGTVWRETILHRFQDLSDGAYPGSGLSPTGQGNYASTTTPKATSNFGQALRAQLPPSSTAFNVHHGF